MGLLHELSFREVVDHLVLLVEALILVGLVWSRAEDQTRPKAHWKSREHINAKLPWIAIKVTASGK